MKFEGRKHFKIEPKCYFIKFTLLHSHTVDEKTPLFILQFKSLGGRCVKGVQKNE